MKTTSRISDLDMGNGRMASTNKEKADTLNSFFCSVFTRENHDTPILQSTPNDTPLDDITLTEEIIKNNYRPISVLSFFSKIFEKIMYNNVVNFMDKNDTFYKYQFGFRKSHSTQHAIITLVDKISSSLDSGNLIIGVFLDLKKAFDTVNHHILLKNFSVMASEVAL